MPQETLRNSEGVRRFSISRPSTQPLQGCSKSIAETTMTQVFKVNPGLELANAFSVIQRRVSPCLQRNVLEINLLSALLDSYLISFIDLNRRLHFLMRDAQLPMNRISGCFPDRNRRTRLHGSIARTTLDPPYLFNQKPIPVPYRQEVTN